MKYVITIIVTLCSLSPVFSQNDLIDRLTKQAVEIDSLKKVVKAEMDIKQQLSKDNYSLLDTLTQLKSELAILEEFRTEKKKYDTLLRKKADSIVLLKADISEKDKQIITERQKSEQKAREEYENGKNEILTTIINSYKNKSFDDLLKSATKESVQRDFQLLQNQTEVKQTLYDLEKYFSAKELLDFKFDPVRITNAQNQLSLIKPESALVNELKKKIGNYQTFNIGFKETLENINKLDTKESVYSLSKEIQKKKFDKILAETSPFIFNYDFNLSDYSYISDVFLELIKRKQPNADADISDLLEKL